MTKNNRSPKFTMKWSKRIKDHVFDGDEGIHTGTTGRVVDSFLFNMKNENGKTFVEELEERGFDITTLKLQFNKKSTT